MRFINILSSWESFGREKKEIWFDKKSAVGKKSLPYMPLCAKMLIICHFYYSQKCWTNLFWNNKFVMTFASILNSKPFEWYNSIQLLKRWKKKFKILKVRNEYAYNFKPSIRELLNEKCRWNIPLHSKLCWMVSD